MIHINVQCIDIEIDDLNNEKLCIKKDSYVLA